MQWTLWESMSPQASFRVETLGLGSGRVGEGLHRAGPSHNLWLWLWSSGGRALQAGMWGHKAEVMCSRPPQRRVRFAVSLSTCWQLGSYGARGLCLAQASVRAHLGGPGQGQGVGRWRVLFLLGPLSMLLRAPARGGLCTWWTLSCELMTQCHANPVFHSRSGEWLLHDPADPEYHGGDTRH